jgi:hypothetical protein
LGSTADAPVLDGLAARGWRAACGRAAEGRAVGPVLVAEAGVGLELVVGLGLVGSLEPEAAGTTIGDADAAGGAADSTVGTRSDEDSDPPRGPRENGDCQAIQSAPMPNATATPHLQSEPRAAGARLEPAPAADAAAIPD